MISFSNVKPLSNKEMKAVVGGDMDFPGECCKFNDSLPIPYYYDCNGTCSLNKKCYDPYVCRPL